MTEEQLHIKCVTYLRNECPSLNGLYFHVPNGGSRNTAEASKFQAMGVLAGVPDLGVIAGGKTYWIELKTEKGEVKKNQKELHANWAKHGVYVVIVRTFEEFLAEINNIKEIAFFYNK